jgi:hypothetical protein
MFNQSDPSSRWKLRKALGKEVNMKKSLRILTVLSIAASSVLFASPSQAASSDRWVAASSPTQFYVKDISNLIVGTTVSFKSVGTPDNLLYPFPTGVTISAISNTPTTFNLCGGITQYTCTGSSPFANGDSVYAIQVNKVIFFYWTLAEFTFDAAVTSSPGAPTSVTATSTGATTANVSFTAPISDGGATITSYTATSSPGGITGTISQAGSGTIAITGLTAGTAYTFTVRATNSVGPGTVSSASNSITTVGAPSAPTSVVATATGKRSATVSFAAPASNGGSAITSYKATSTPGGLTQTLTQAAGGTFTFDGLQPGTAYTFAVTATNAIGTSAAATSNSVTTTPLVVASLSALSFADDGTGTGGKIVWSGKNIDAVLYTGSAAYYPGPYNYGAFTGGWNGRIRNLTPDTSYTVSLFVVSADGVGESKSLTFKTSATLPALPGAKSATVSQADQMAAQLPKLFAWINENVFVDGEGDRMKTVLNKFDAMTVPAHSAYLKLPNSTVVKVSATSSTPAVCKVEGQVTVHSIAAGTCTISYTVSGGSKAPATMVKDFVFAKFAK